MIYMVPDEPEMGYFGEDEVFPCHRGTDQLCVGDEEDRIFHNVEEADCSICEGAIPQDATLPLCASCEGAARAHGKLLADAKRYPDPEVNMR